MNPNANSPQMKIVPFIAESAEDAVAQIRQKLGSDAVVVNVRQLAAGGLAKLWKSPRIEVLAYKPDAQSASAPDPLLELRKELQALRSQLDPAPESNRPPGIPTPDGALGRGARSAGVASWRVADVLE